MYSTAQQQPAGYNPFMANGVNMYESARAMRLEAIRHRNEYITKRLKENFPTKYVTIHCGLLALSAVVVIAVQIVGIVNKSKLHEAGSGIWLGAAYLLVILPIYMLCIYKVSICLFIKFIYKSESSHYILL